MKIWPAGMRVRLHRLPDKYEKIVNRLKILDRGEYKICLRVR